MKRIIYTIYIDIDKQDLDYQPPYSGETEPKNDKTKRMLAEYYDWLSQRQLHYAFANEIEYRQFLDDDRWQEFKLQYQQKYPILTMYNIVNFYKIHLLYELMNEGYDEILYMDMDVVPVSDINFFEAHNLDKGICIYRNHAYVERTPEELNKKQERYLKDGINQTVRSPYAKWWNSRALISELGEEVPRDHPVYNTGIVGTNANYLKQLDYFGDFDDMIDMMTEMRYDEFSMYPTVIRDVFGWDNETLWGVKTQLNNVPIQWLSGRWHYFMDRKNFVPPKTNFIHVINKNFDFVKDWYEKNSIQPVL